MATNTLASHMQTLKTISRVVVHTLQGSQFIVCTSSCQQRNMQHPIDTLTRSVTKKTTSCEMALLNTVAFEVSPRASLPGQKNTVD